eukprot:scaffold14778_cov109-Isochrysis_galbana.AAC.4
MIQCAPPFVCRLGGREGCGDEVKELRGVDEADSRRNLRVHKFCFHLGILGPIPLPPPCRTPSGDARAPHGPSGSAADSRARFAPCHRLDIA